jgi:hypothetical protein
MKRVRQLELDLTSWGGRREGAGRKRKQARSSPPHRARAGVREWAPQLVTLRMREGLPNLRKPATWEVVKAVMRAFRGRFAVAIIHYSMLANHLHLIVECSDRSAFVRGMRALCIRLGKRLAAHFGVEGPILASRYHARELPTPREVWNGLRYTLLNARRHGARAGLPLPIDTLDRYSTAASFDGWASPVDGPYRDVDFGTSPPRSWLLRVGWRRHGPLDPNDVPGASRGQISNERMSAAA